MSPPRDPAVEPLLPVFGQQLGWTRYLTAVAGRVPTVLYTHQRHALVLRFPAEWTLVEVQIGDPEVWTLTWRPNLVLAQPAVLGARTNLTMFFSDGRILQAALVEVSRDTSGRHGQVYVGPEPWLASQLLATLPDRLRGDADDLELAALLGEPETLVARLEGTYVPYLLRGPWPRDPALEDLSLDPDEPAGSPTVPPPDPDPGSDADVEPLSVVPSDDAPGSFLPPDFPGTLTPDDLGSSVPNVFPDDPPDFGDQFPPLPLPGAAVEPLGELPLSVPALGPRLPGAVPLAAVVAGPLPQGASGIDPAVLARLIEREAPPRLVLPDPAPAGDAQSFAPPPVSAVGSAASGVLVSGARIEAVDAEVRALREQLAQTRRAAGERVAAAVLQSEQEIEQWRSRLPEQVQMSLVWDPPVPPWTPPLWHWGAWHDGRYTYIRMVAPDPQFYDLVTDRVLTAEVTDRSLYAIDGVFDQLAVSVRDPENRGSLVQVILRRRVELEYP